MFDSGMIALRYAARVTDGFKVEVELNEELPLNPLVFACLVNDRLTNEVRQESQWMMMFADDIVICSEQGADGKNS